jgi:hypothetical protein
MEYWRLPLMEDTVYTPGITGYSRRLLSLFQSPLAPAILNSHTFSVRGEQSVCIPPSHMSTGYRNGENSPPEHPRAASKIWTAIHVIPARTARPFPSSWPTHCIHLDTLAVPAPLHARCVRCSCLFQNIQIHPGRASAIRVSGRSQTPQCSAPAKGTDPSAAPRTPRQPHTILVMLDI